MEKTPTKRITPKTRKAYNKGMKPTFEVLFAEIGQKTAEELSGKYGVSEQTIQRWLSYYGLIDASALLRMPPKAELKTVFEKHGIRDSAKHYGVSMQTLKDWLFKIGVADRNYHSKPSIKVPVERQEYFLQQYYLGLMDYDDIAEEIGISATSVQYWIRSEYDVRYAAGFKPTDEDLKAEAKIMSVRELAEFYAVDVNVIVTWAILARVKLEKGF